MVSDMDRIITGWMADHAISLIRVSLGIVFLWFGALKFFPGLSVAETLAGRTIQVLTLGHVPPQVSVPVLAACESLIGLGLLTGVAPRDRLPVIWCNLRVSLRQNLRPKGRRFAVRRRRFSVEQIVGMLKQAEVGVPVAGICRQAGITEQTFYRWKKQYVGLEVDQVRQLKQLQEENARLKKLVAELSLDKTMLQDVLSKKL